MINESLNKILKEMWRLDEKVLSGETLNQEEQDFYNTHLIDIKKYYTENDLYWKNQKNI